MIGDADIVWLAWHVAKSVIGFNIRGGNLSLKGLNSSGSEAERFESRWEE